MLKSSLFLGLIQMDLSVVHTQGKNSSILTFMYIFLNVMIYSGDFLERGLSKDLFPNQLKKKLEYCNYFFSMYSNVWFLLQDLQRK